MAGKLGGFSQFMTASTKEAARAEANKGMTIQLIDMDDLIPNPDNKYALRDIDQLAGMIEANGFHVEALEVVKTDETGKYMIIAGHRRQAAWRKLVECGATDDKRLPCFVRTFTEQKISYTDDEGNKHEEVISPKAQKLISLILSNRGQRQHKTLEEQIWEVEQLEPYAKILYLARHKNREFKGSFKDFFAKEILEISPSALQRKRKLLLLTEKAKKALYEDGIISEAAARQIASLPPDEQDAYIDKIRSGEHSGFMKDIEVPVRENPAETEDDEAHEPDEPSTSEAQKTIQTEENDDDDDDDDVIGIGMNDSHVSNMPDFEKEEEERRAQEEEKEKRTAIPKAVDSNKAVKLEDIPVPSEIGDPQKEAENWFNKSMIPLYKQVLVNAESQQEAAEYAGNEVEAAQWGIRVAVAKFRLAEFSKS